MTAVRRRLGVAALVLVCAASLAASSLKPATRAAFERYVAVTEARLARERSGTASLFWIDGQPEKDRAKLYARLRGGEIIVTKIDARDEANRKIEAPDGIIHDWLATVMFSGVPIDRAVRFVQDYDHYPDHFKPMIQKAHLRGHDGDRFDVTMQLYAKKVITVVLNAEYVIEYHQIDPTRVWSASRSTRIAEVENYGKPDEREKPADKVSGYLWRTNLYCTFEDRADGTIEQCESLSLTRDAPFGLGWLVGPFVKSVPREALEYSLGRARADLIAKKSP